jgi:hypothetical protein
MSRFLELEIMAEVALQMGDTNDNIPRAEARWSLVDITKQIISDGFITEHTTDIDEHIQKWLRSHEYLAKPTKRFKVDYTYEVRESNTVIAENSSLAAEEAGRLLFMFSSDEIVSGSMQILSIKVMP